MKTGLADILGEPQIIADLRAADRWEAIDELVGRLADTGAIRTEDREAITGAVRKREQSMSTGIGLGVAIPHARTDLIAEAVAALGRSRNGIAFEALDGQPVHLVILILVPQAQLQRHLHTVADLAGRLRRPEFRSALEQAPDAAAMLQIIRNQA